ncbi:precorrin-6Y C5,15-methyltransferase (decarboxylating) CbiT subunit [Desulfohalotomaculum tongense]|uniref:precorrin-6Y C5,15-methyltransferase (decarboxylating) subunit CbiT n=1 Tax=Desulforadius tongensis TaxID=1216062 RepID=UPI00195603FB|nr:precorrin-6Y C5,15-methyltransferase (decarboxylating) subunit CbiT [Desulforadius tongensis]MBM7854343.1 precorrin-6Y C5,15-methyltransferase (decarboxylating) CbiT subunit [Desulforadius tongensis]
MRDIWPYSTPGIPDRLFVRREGVPITAAEIRAVVLSKLRLCAGITAYDVGAGSGSVTVEMGLQVKDGTVYALECKPDALLLVKENTGRFGLKNVKVIAGDAAQVMAELPPAHRIFIGGSGGKLAEILTGSHNKLLPGGILVATAVTLDTAPVVRQFLAQNGYQDIEVVSLNLARTAKVGRVNLWRANNPVQIVSGIKCD